MPNFEAVCTVRSTFMKSAQILFVLRIFSDSDGGDFQTLFFFYSPITLFESFFKSVPKSSLRSL